MIVVTDTSVVLNLAWLGEERLLRELFEGVLAPPEVRAEFARLTLVDPRFLGLPFPAFISIEAPASIPDSLATDHELDPGETAALALALERGIRDVLIDETAARAVAVALGLRPSGLLGLLVAAKRRALLPRVVPLLARLRDGAKFRIGDDLLRRIADLAGETSG